MIQVHELTDMRELTDTELDAVSGGATASPIPLPYFSPQQANIPTQFGVSYFGNVFQAMGPNINFNFA